MVIERAQLVGAARRCELINAPSAGFSGPRRRQDGKERREMAALERRSANRIFIWKGHAEWTIRAKANFPLPRGCFR